ncbi:hypothetical protein V6N13_109202 [Hibiscus sabdariffa]|uniref:Uncharacterized protein n=1 Tax=Hibiscus sabdariffa TaxID=183260 RepID=A0ABR2FPD0_9ROSI
MNVEKMKQKKNMLQKARERCRSLGNTGKKPPLMRKSRSFHVFSSLEEDKRKKKKCSLVSPQGCFSVYVGPQRQRFVIKTKMANHSLFKALLEDAELEYGCSREDPLLLPCDVALFDKVLAEIDDNGDEEISPSVWSFGCSSSRYRSKSIRHGYGSHKLLFPSIMIRLNSY